jgi:hypothetical protein
MVFLPLFIVNGVLLLAVVCACSVAWLSRILPCINGASRSFVRDVTVMCPLATLLLGLFVAFEVFLCLKDSRSISWSWPVVFVPAFILYVMAMLCCYGALWRGNVSYPRPPAPPMDPSGIGGAEVRTELRSLRMTRRNHMHNNINYDDDVTAMSQHERYGAGPAGSGGQPVLIDSDDDLPDLSDGLSELAFDDERAGSW